MIITAARERQEAEWQRTAWLLAGILSFFSSTSITAKSLLEPPDPTIQREAFNAAAGLTDPVDVALAKQRARG